MGKTGYSGDSGHHGHRGRSTMKFPWRSDKGSVANEARVADYTSEVVVKSRAVPGVTFTGGFAVSINTTNARVADSFEAGGQRISFDLPAGPYVRVDGTDVQLNVAGQSLGGDFGFHAATLNTGENVQFNFNFLKKGTAFTGPRSIRLGARWTF